MPRGRPFTSKTAQLHANNRLGTKLTGRPEAHRNYRVSAQKLALRRKQKAAQ